MIAVLLLMLVGACLLAAAWRDLAVRRIPNAMAAGVALAGVSLRALDGAGALGTTLAAATLLFVVLFLGFARGILGGGDVKLATAAALGLSPAGVWTLVLATALAGGVLSLVYLVMGRLTAGRVAVGGRSTGAARRVARVERWRIKRCGPLPYGIAISAGACIAFSNQLVVH